MLFVKRFRAGTNRKHSVLVHNLRNGGFGYGVPSVFQNRINFTASENFVVIVKYLFDNGKHFCLSVCGFRVSVFVAQYVVVVLYFLSYCLASIVILRIKRFLISNSLDLYKKICYTFFSEEIEGVRIVKSIFLSLHNTMR